MPEAETLPIDHKVIFVCGERSFTVRDIIDAALFRGEVEPAWNELLRLEAAERKADEENLEFSDDAIDAAAERFRYEHDLITAEETEQWLAQRGLNLADFSAYFVRHYWGEQFDDVEPAPLDYLSAPNEMRELLTTELILSGELDRMAVRLSWRVAASLRAEGAPVDPGLIAAEESQFFRERRS